jgi:hypothetical protein
MISTTTTVETPRLLSCVTTTVFPHTVHTPVSSSTSSGGTRWRVFPIHGGWDPHATLHGDSGNLAMPYMLHDKSGVVALYQATPSLITHVTMIETIGGVKRTKPWITSNSLKNRRRNWCGKYTRILGIVGTVASVGYDTYIRIAEYGGESDPTWSPTRRRGGPN